MLLAIRSQRISCENQHLKFAEGPDDIGIIISYNTEAPDVAIGTTQSCCRMVLQLTRLTGKRPNFRTAAQILDH